MPYLIYIALGLSIAVLARLSFSRSKCVDLLSWLIHVYLCWRYRITHEITGKTIPTCPYRWPNGQGDTAKFLEGLANSEKWDSKYGGIYRIWSGMTPEIVLTAAMQLKIVFRDSDKHSKAVDNNSGYLMSQILGKCLGLISGKPWRELRQVSDTYFAHSNAKAYLSTIRDTTAQFVDSLRRERLQFGGHLDPVQDLKILPFLTVAAILYGELGEDLEQDLLLMAPNREELFKHVIAGGLSRFTWSMFFPLQANKQLRAFHEKWRAFNSKAHDRAIAAGNHDLPIVRLYAVVANGSVTMDNVLQTLDEMLFANLDVTAGALSWHLTFLATHPERQRKLRQEIEAVTNMDDYLVKSKSYMTACINEAARLKPLAAFSVPQSAPTTRLLGKFNIPAGTNFVVDTYALNVRNAFWGDDCTTYRPERWASIDAREFRYNYWRFGFGPRQCLGRYVADIMLRVLTVELLKDSELAPYDNHVGPKDIQRDTQVWIDQPVTKLSLLRIKEDHA